MEDVPDLPAIKRRLLAAVPRLLGDRITPYVALAARLRPVGHHKLFFYYSVRTAGCSAQIGRAGL